MPTVRGVPQSPDMSDLAKTVRSHIEGKLARTQIEVSPFPHLVVSDFFPEEVYARILELNVFQVSEGKRWLNSGRARATSTETPYFARRQINFHKDGVLDSLRGEHAEFWNELSAIFLDDDWFPRLVIDTYRPYFEIRFGDALERDDFCQLFRRERFLQRHEPGYFIGPHTDVPQRVFTCIFSFASEEGFDQYGTQLLSHKYELTRCFGHNHYPPEDFTVRKLAPYRPNNFLLFFKTRQSFHAVAEIDESVPNQRYGMQFQFYETGGGIFTELSKPDLFVNTRIRKQQTVQTRLMARVRGGLRRFRG